MQTIKIVCPAGSGMNFALSLLQLSFRDQNVHITTAGHERKDIAEEVPTLVILRNPYDAIASGAERWLRSSDHRVLRNNPYLIEDDNIVDIVKQIQYEKFRYRDFFKNIEDLKHVKILTFDLLTKNPEAFVAEVSKHFGLESEIIKRSEQEVIEHVINSGNPNRVPRNKGKGREKIDRLIKAMYPEEEFQSLRLYIDLKEKIEKGLI